MTREEAIEELEKSRRLLLAWKIPVEELDIAIEALKEPHWIPCSERLPETDGRYLVTCSKIGAWVVDWNIWHNEPKPSWLWEQGVTAWMPLPEPFKEEES